MKCLGGKSYSLTLVVQNFNQVGGQIWNAISAKISHMRSAFKWFEWFKFVFKWFEFLLEWFEFLFEWFDFYSNGSNRNSNGSNRNSNGSNRNSNGSNINSNGSIKPFEYKFEHKFEPFER